MTKPELKAVIDELEQKIQKRAVPDAGSENDGEDKVDEEEEEEDKDEEEDEEDEDGEAEAEEEGEGNPPATRLPMKRRTRH